VATVEGFHVDALAGAIRKKARLGVEKAADRLAEDVRRRMDKRTGKTARGVEARVIEENDVIEGLAASDHPNAVWQEFGTSKMAPDPSFRPALDALERDLIRDVENELR
jgi:HK97 gp10 family phage protein